MHLFIDILLVAVFGFLVFRGWMRGFIKAVLSLARLVLSLVLTLLIGPSVADWLDQTLINPAVYKAVFSKLSAIAADITAEAEGGVEALVGKLPDTYRDHLNLSAIDPSDKIEDVVESWSVSISGGISNVIATVVGYVLLFAVCFLLFTLVIFIVSKCVKASKFNKTDKLLGLGLGAASGVTAVIFLSVVLGALLSLLGQGDAVESSFMLRLFSGLREWILS